MIKRVSEFDKIKVGDELKLGSGTIKIKQNQLDGLKQFEVETGKESIYEGEITDDAVLWISVKRNEYLAELKKENDELKKEIDELKKENDELKETLVEIHSMIKQDLKK